MKYAKIIATGSYLPQRILTNAELEQMVATSDEWIIERTGIKERHIIAEGEKTSDMAFAAATKALATAGVSADELDLIIVATSTPDSVFPPTACIVQEKLNNKGAAAFDMQAACNGFISALTTADCYVRAGMAKKALVIGADAMSRIIDYSDRGTCILFGDGAGAVLLEASNTLGILGNEIHSDGAFGKILTCEGHLYNGVIGGNPFIEMDGQAVFKFAVRALSAVAKSLAKTCAVELSEIDWLIPHQANIRIIESTAKMLGSSMDKVITTVDKHGNTSAASVPLALDIAIRDGRIKTGHKVLLEGVGAGFTWGASLIQF